MKYTWRVGRIPDGNTPVGGQAMAVRAISDGSTLTTIQTDEDGFATLQGNGHYVPFYVIIGDVPGGDKIWRSDDSKATGVFSPRELPAVLRPLDGVVRGYASELAVSLVSGGPSVSVAPGGACVVGHPFVVYSAVGLSNSRPVSGTRIDRVILRLYPEGSATTPGKAEVALLAGTVDAGAPSLTQTATVYELSLAQVSVPSAGTITLTDERIYAGEKNADHGEARAALVTTTNGSGEALPGLSITLDLPRAATYDIEAEFSAIQSGAASVSAWVLQGTFGSLGSGNDNFNTPNQVAVDTSGNVYIADRENNRLVKRDSSGAFVAQITGLTDCTGVAVDASGNIYVNLVPTANWQVKKYNSSLVLQATTSFGIGVFLRHMTTDGTHLFIAASDNRIYTYLCSTLALVTSWGGTGSGDGQLTFPYGIAVDSTHVYVSDRDLDRVQKFTRAGAYVTKWGTTGTSDGQFDRPHGVALDDSGDVWVCDYDNDRLQRFSNVGAYQTTIAQANPIGVDLATGDVLWVSNFEDDSIAKWDEVVTPGGYGQIAIEIDSVVSDYTGLGERDGALGNVALGSKAGPGTCVVRAFGKATANTLTLQSAVLSARAVPRA